MQPYSQYTDQELAGLLKSGDRQAYEEIYHRYKFVLHNHAWNKVRNKQEAEDALQEVFSKLWDRRLLFEANVNVSGYLYASVRNYLLNLIARRNVRDRYISNIQRFTEQDTVVTDHRIRENQLREIIEREISALPPRMREVFEMSRKEHLTHKDIAARLGTAEETVKKQISAALKVLRSRLGFFIYIYFLCQR